MLGGGDGRAWCFGGSGAEGRGRWCETIDVLFGVMLYRLPVWVFVAQDASNWRRWGAHCVRVTSIRCHR
jgi:hypothetical protein